MQRELDRSHGPGSQEDPASVFEDFKQHSEAVGARVSRVESIAQAASVIASARDLPTLTHRYTSTNAVLNAYPDLTDALLQKGIVLRTSEEITSQSQQYNSQSAIRNPQSNVAAALAGDIGIVLAVAGVAETGSVLCADETLPARLLGMLADSVFVLLSISDIVPSLDEMGDILSRKVGDGSRYLSMVTGPSRTADIERVLTIGVQGPKVLHILAIADRKP
jgi:L-lactate dehydrogenase complex protein LldG